MKERDWKKEKIVSIDFDAVLAEYEGFKGPMVVGKPIKGAKKFINAVRTSGFTPVIFTTRDVRLIEGWLVKNNFPKIEVTNNKFPSVVYIDDRSIQFKGDYDKLFCDMKKFDVYWRKKQPHIFDALKNFQ